MIHLSDAGLCLTIIKIKIKITYYKTQMRTIYITSKKLKLGMTFFLSECEALIASQFSTVQFNDAY